MPTQQEMNDMMKEMQKAMDDMSPEDKRMMDSMGFKMPDMKNMQQMASFASANANAEQNVLVPKRDAARIASIQKTPLTKSALPAYLQSLYQTLTTQLPTAIVTKAHEPVQSTAYVSRLGLLPPLAAEKAALVLGDPLNGASAQRVEEIKKQIESFDTTADSLEAKYNSRYQETKAKYSPKFGEGKANPFEAACQDHSSAQNEYLSAVNGLLSKLHLSYLKAYRQYSYDLLYYALNTQPQLQYEITRTNVQLQWIGALQMLKPVFMKYKEMYCLNVPKPAETRHTLANFDDINCQYKSTMNLLFGTINTECGRTTAEMEIDFVKIGWETQSADREKNRNFFDEFQRCTIEVSAGKNKSSGEGPLQLQTSVGATGFLEFDRTGLKDAGVKLNADISVGTNVFDTKVETGIGEVNVGPKEPSVSVGGVNAIISINSGFTAGGSGILKGVKL